MTVWHPIAAALFALSAICLTSTAFADDGAADFDSMEVDAGSANACRLPRPPRDIAGSAYVRNGYRAILRIMAVERWQDTGSCECFLTEISWIEVVAESSRFVTSDNPRRPFDVVALNATADRLEADRELACGGS